MESSKRKLSSRLANALGGNNAGMSTILVLSGSTKKEDLKDSEIKPDYVINDLRDLLKDIPTK